MHAREITVSRGSRASLGLPVNALFAGQVNFLKAVRGASWVPFVNSDKTDRLDSTLRRRTHLLSPDLDQVKSRTLVLTSHLLLVL